MKAGFTGGILVDYPNSTKAKKFFLVLMTGGIQQMPRALGTGDEVENSRQSQVSYEAKRDRVRNARGKPLKKRRDWILEKKERRRKKGIEVRPDTKYTGRKRKDKF